MADEKNIPVVINKNVVKLARMDFMLKNNLPFSRMVDEIVNHLAGHQ